MLNESVFRGRNLKVGFLPCSILRICANCSKQVVPKRTNVPGMTRGRGRGRGGGRGGFGRGGGGFPPRGGYRGGYRGRGRGYMPY